MSESGDDWSIHDLDRVPEPPPDLTLSPRTYSHTMLSSHHLMSSRNSMSGSTREAGEGRNRSRFQRRGWGSTTGAGGPGGGPSGSNTSGNPSAVGPRISLNLEAVMSFPPMSDEHIAISNNAEAAADLRRSNSSSLWSDQRSPNQRLSGSHTQLHHHNSITGQSLTGMSLTAGSIDTLRDESISEHVEGGEENVTLSKLPPMPLHSSYTKTGSGHKGTQQSPVVTGLSAHQRARFSEHIGNAGGASRVRLDTGGSSSTRSRLDKHNDLSENSDRPGAIRQASMEHGSDSSWVDETEHGAADEDTEAGDSATSDTRKGIKFCGVPMPHWLVSWRPSLHRVSTMVVTRAPCFICWGYRQPTDRSILARLNVLVAIFATIQLASAVFLASVSWNNPDEHAIENLTEEEKDARSTRGPVLFNVWTVNVYIYFTGMLAFINFTSAVLTIRVIRNVNLVGAIRYLWSTSLFDTTSRFIFGLSMTLIFFYFFPQSCYGSSLYSFNPILDYLTIFESRTFG